MSAASIEKAFPLSPLQEGMLYHTLRDPAAGVFVVQCTAELRGALDIGRFSEAWHGVMQRHAALRTFFAWENRERPLQVVRTNAPIHPDVLDWSSANPDEVERQWQELLQKDRARGFDLLVAPLMRLTVVRTGAMEHRLLWSVHHVVIDGWSALLVLEEVLRDYTQLVSGMAMTIGTAPSFDRFIGWLETHDHDSAQQFWPATLAGMQSEQVLPGGRRARPTGGTRMTAVHHLSVDDTRRLQMTAARNGVTVNTLLMGAWAVVLARHTGSDDVTFGVTVSERPVEITDVERAVGLYLMTVPVRAPAQNGSYSGDWLRTLQRTLSDARAHGAPGLAAIQRLSGLPSGDALFDTLIVFEDFPAKSLRPFTTSLSPSAYDASETSRESDSSLTIASATMDVPNDVPLVLMALPGEQLQLKVIHDPELVSGAIASRLANQVATVLNGFGGGDRALDALPVLDEAEAAMLEAWSGADVPAPSAHDVLARFREQAAQRPTGIALHASDGAVSYDALNRHANRLAARLTESGAGSGTIVGVLTKQPAHAVAAMLACLSLGATYTVLDATAPPTRLARMLQHVEVVFAAPGLEQLAASGKVVCVLDNASRYPDASVDRTLSADCNAYIVFTSGSTGEPKGVIVSRRALAISTAARDLYYNESPERFLLLSPMSVDSAVAGIYWTLCTGGALVLPESRAEQDIEQLAALVQSTAITHTLMVASLYRMVLDHVEPKQLSSLRVVVVAGEACTEDIVQMHVSRLPDVALHNEYGPSEATVWTTAVNLTDPDNVHPDGRRVSIGRPIPGARVYVLDDLMRTVPTGAVGEICIGGPILADGYIGMPEETARRFVAYPSHPGNRIYRTGDRARFLENGCLDFLGRDDDQLKIRGFRVEAGEIERALLLHPAVQDAAVSLFPPPSDLRTATLVSELGQLSDADADALLTHVEMMT